MTSAAPLEILDENDEEFDWEAAVREIEVACSKANPSTSASAQNVSTPSHSWGPHCSNRADGNGCIPGKRKQSTLDRFVAKAGPGKDSPVVVEVEDNGETTASAVELDAEAAKTWIYPVNIPLRDYQFAITKTALFSNTLVALPTGLGKTLIAAVVMFNYFRWFPEGKIVFAAPSRPLVLQQIEACHNIVGIPQEQTIDMTGQINPTRRAFFWKTKRVFFVTPQVLEKDIQAGTCLARCLVCLVIDEAHRALGNYSYCVAVRELMEVPVQLRILALTATPGSKQQAIQHIIDNLRISTLEYRNESDSDVSPYVHDRKIELIEVPLGRDATSVNQQLLEVIRPYAARLSSLGLLQNRDYQTLSPPDLLNSREHFRRAPPADLPQNKYGEIEAYFGSLITLYHIRKLLSSHGIRPAYEMLEEKLNQGSFARLMGRNESIRKVKVLMEQSLSQRAPSPKLAKMLQVLVDHFKTKDPLSSRVIIFSNFRGSVRDIMDALADIGDIVKATEFIGQSSAKHLKGQSQKVQQAVLQKFRAGGYNVIVATSIGEEGLDIMEVDLVICFDANVSPLRMIQRMGRTGRKHDGRVVVLACEGSELKGYMRKQANSRSIKKHMHNGGIHSFNFHPSPRMIPHIFKPEVQFVELSIEKYIPRGKRRKEDNAVEAFSFDEKLTCEESALLAKYFQPTDKSTWRPSLIAFPHSQAFPSRVLKVMHSSRTNMLIDSMQHLQGLSVSTDGEAFSNEDGVSSGKCCGVNFVDEEDNHKGASLALDGSTRSNKQMEATESELSHERIEEQCVQHVISRSPPAHSFLFNSDVVSVDDLGRVQILCVPSLPFKHANPSGYTKDDEPLLVKHVEQNAFNPKLSDPSCKEITNVGEHAPELFKFQVAPGSDSVLETLNTYVANVRHVEELDQVETTANSPHLKRNMLNGGDCALERLGMMEIEAPTLGDECNNKFGDSEMSPRLNNLILTGIVPESPVSHNENLGIKARDDCVTPELISTSKSSIDLPGKLPRVGINTTPGRTSSFSERNMSSSTNKILHSPSALLDTVVANGQQALVSPVDVGTTSTKKSSSEDWFVESAGKSQNCRLKRLRKVGDNRKIKNSDSSKKSLLPVVNLEERFFDNTWAALVKRKKKKNGVLEVFIEEEAEVSSEHEVSSDELCEGGSSYEDSFIDDRINPTPTSTQAESSRVDMQAVYRRSLLSQSPMEREISFATSTPSSSSLMNRTDRSGSCSIKTSSSPQRSEINVELRERNPGAVPITTTTSTREKGSKLGTRKRQLNFVQLGPTTCIDLEKSSATKSDVVERNSICHVPTDDINTNDDQFFASVDLDAVEEQATMVLQHRSQIQKVDIHPNADQQNFDHHSTPSFDLGIC